MDCFVHRIKLSRCLITHFSPKALMIQRRAGCQSGIPEAFQRVQTTLLHLPDVDEGAKPNLESGLRDNPSPSDIALCCDGGL